ncbi:MAG: metal ABC transporter solute-binding protein, Zn/Mn family [Candidatus Nitrosotenuis sp.]
MRKSLVVAIGAAIVVIAILVGLQATTQTSKEPSRQETMIPQPQASKIKVIASFYPLYEFTKNVARDKADVSVFTPVGIEPHDWEPSTQDLVVLDKSDVFVYNGMEPYVGKIIDQYPNVLFVETSQGVDLGTASDPHIWLDPVLAKDQVIMIKDSLIKVDPNNAQYYEDNANAYSDQLNELDNTIRTELASCKKDTIVPFHNAFSYFGSRYGIKIHALSGIIPESEPTTTDLKNLIDYVKQNQIKVIFAEELVDPKLAQTLADEVGVQIMILSPLEGLSKDELSSGKSYLDKMYDNLNNIKVALECA